MSSESWQGDLAETTWLRILRESLKPWRSLKSETQIEIIILNLG